MNLSQLQEGDKAIITKIKGRGEFRKRIIEMGFIKGKEIKVIKYAPLKDPIEYEIMGYQVSLRKAEADLIEVEPVGKPIYFQNNHAEVISDENDWAIRIRERTHTINVALVGNPNCGKTTIFNFITGAAEHVGNYGGVTVDAKKGKTKKFGYTFEITDLPGTYSLSAYTPEEVYVRNHLFYELPDVIINVVDGSNLERNLYLTTQLIDMNIPTVIALNMYDEMQQRGDKIDYKSLSKLLGMPVVPTIGATGFGIDKLLQTVIEVYEEKNPDIRPIKINYGPEIEEAIEELKILIDTDFNSHITNIISPHFIAIKLLEKDPKIKDLVKIMPNGQQIIETTNRLIKHLENILKEDTEVLIADARYGFIAGALKETYQEGNIDKFKTTKVIDSVLTHKYFGFPIFLVILWIMFESTFRIGGYFAGWIQWLVDGFGFLVDKYMADGMLKDLIIQGIVGGVGSVLVFLPNILILFLFISFLEDTGYMARVAFIMDKLMHRIGLHGKSFIPMLMGFGCNVPAIMATRTLENKKDRLVTMLIIPFMSCSARLPVYILILGTFFPRDAGTIMLGIYILGVIVAILTAILLNKTLFKKEQAPFVMELPPYRMPTTRVVVKHMWHKGKEYINKMGGVILVASIIIWTLGYFPRLKNNPYEDEIKHIQQQYSQLIKANPQQASVLEKQRDSLVALYQVEAEASRQYNSYIARLGKAIEPFMRPLGFDWKATVAIIAGFSAKEIVVSTMSVLYQSTDNTQLQQKLKQATYPDGPNKGKPVFTIPVVIAFIIFVLLYVPCVATVTAIARESGSWKWALFSIAYSISVAWILAFVAKNIAQLLI